MDFLRARAIETGVYYNRPIYRQPVYRRLGLNGRPLTCAETVSRQVVSLPVHPELRDRELGRIVRAAREFA